MRLFIATLLALVLPACTEMPPIDVPDYVDNPTQDRFSVCYDWGCSSHAVLSLPEHHWRSIQDIFEPAARTAEDERRQIARAVASLERYTGAALGTSRDEARNNTADSDRYQLDCVDEALNTTSYLRLLDSAHLLRWHRVETPIHRGNPLTRTAHHTAVIRQTDSGEEFAVDSWFEANGKQPYIVPLKIWQAGWMPAPLTDISCPD